VPGAGHFLLRKWGRGALLAASILGMFVLGWPCRASSTRVRTTFWTFWAWPATWATGCCYFVSRILGLGADQVQVTTADYGTRFIVVAGLLNVIAAVDAHNLRTGRKS
jgi:hypothetical protein